MLSQTPRHRQIGVGGLTISQRAKRYVLEVLHHSRLSYGPFSQKFEAAFAKEHDCRYASFMNSGTDALRIALAALKARYRWRSGDEVLVPAITFVATANIVLQNGMIPVFVDVDPRTYNIDAAQIEAKITRKTRAIIPVHLMGLPCAMDPIGALARKHKLRIIEDSCETMFGTYKGRKVGSLGDIGTFSTYVAHFLVTGVGGLATTNHRALAVDIKSLMNHGRDPIYLKIDDDKNVADKQLQKIVERRFRFLTTGYSSRCTEMEAALGLAQLEEKGSIVRKRRQIAEHYTRALRPYEDRLQLPCDTPESKHMFMLYPLVLKNENKWKLVHFLERSHIETRDLMPILRAPVYQKLYGNLEPRYPVARWINQSGFYIGCHQEIAQDEQDYVVSKFRDYFRNH